MLESWQCPSGRCAAHLSLIRSHVQYFTPSGRALRSVEHPHAQAPQRQHERHDAQEHQIAEMHKQRRESDALMQLLARLKRSTLENS